jgi:flavin reductase
VTSKTSSLSGGASGRVSGAARRVSDANPVLEVNFLREAKPFQEVNAFGEANFFQEASAFREAMSRVAGAVHLITTDGPGGKAGLTATAVVSVSAEPPTLLVCLNKTSRVAAVVQDNGFFAVSTLGAEQQELAKIFAGRGLAKGEARFEHGKWELGAEGQPVLADALVSFTVRVVEIRPVATHLIVIGEVTRIALGAAHAGLVYTRRAYHSV